MTADFVTKRPHKKSRGGCKTCKTRKTKCDEVQPKCSFCNRRNLRCFYTVRPPRSDISTLASSQDADAPSGSTSPISDNRAENVPSWGIATNPQPLVISSFGVFSPIDLRVMHHWTTFTCNTLVYGEDSKTYLRTTIPQLAFENDFLLNGILGIASLHMQHILPIPEKARKQTDIYRARALNGFRQAVTRLHPNSQSYNAALTMSLLLIVLCAKDPTPDVRDLGIIHWLLLYRGLSSVIMLRSSSGLGNTSAAPIFRRQITEIKSTPAIPAILWNMLKEVHPLDPDYDGLEHYCKTLDMIGVLYASLRDDGLVPALFIRITTWPSYIKQGFADFAKERRPRAMIILAYFLVFVKLAKGMWWIEGIADNHISAIIRLLGPKWLPYLDVPLQALQMTNEEEIVCLVLGERFESRSGQCFSMQLHQ